MHRFTAKMVEREFTEKGKTMETRKHPSVPFLWEEKPGTPKKDWTPRAASVVSLPKPPVKHVVSVPFVWEEKPGTPLPHLSQPQQESVPSTPPAKLLTAPPPLACSPKNDDSDTESWVGGDGDEHEGISDQSDIKTLSSEEDYTFRPAPPSLLANCLVPFKAISTAIPVNDTSGEEDERNRPETPFSIPCEVANNTCSYATSNSSPAGASILELYPLFPPHSGFLEKVGQNDCQAPTEPKSKHDDRESASSEHDDRENSSSEHNDSESASSAVARKGTTLGELILLSRRSHRRKTAQMRKQNLSMVKLELSLPFCLSLIS